MARGQKSAEWHELKRRANLVEYLQMQLSSGRYSSDQDKAINYIVKEKMELALLEDRLTKQEV